MSYEIPSWKADRWSELWKITEWKDGSIYKTEDTGYHIHNDDPLPKDHQRVSFSTSQMIKETVTINPYKGQPEQ